MMRVFLDCGEIHDATLRPLGSGSVGFL